MPYGKASRRLSSFRLGLSMDEGLCLMHLALLPFIMLRGMLRRGS